MDDTIKEILQDGADGRLSNKNKKKAKEILGDKKEWVRFTYNGRDYAQLRDIPIPLRQAERFLKEGKIKAV